MIFRWYSPFLLALGTIKLTFARVLGFEILARVEEVNFRRSECEGCQFFIEESRQCGVCTCFVDGKVWITTESCPKKKWRSIWRKKVES